MHRGSGRVFSIKTLSDPARNEPQRLPGDSGVVPQASCVAGRLVKSRRILAGKTLPDPLWKTRATSKTLPDPIHTRSMSLSARVAVQAERDDVRSRRDRDVLHVVEQVGHRRRLPDLAGLETPERLAALRVGGHQRSAVLAEDHDPAGGAERAAP